MIYRKLMSVLTVLSLILAFSSCSAVRGDDLSTPLTEAAAVNMHGEETIIGAAPSVSAGEGDIIVLYTNDVHCGINDGLGYSGVAALKKDMLQKTPFVTLVDVGDHLQGDTIGVVSRGAYIVQLMNKAGYDLAALGNHEFDYGLKALNSDMMAAKYRYLCCNVRYTGTGNDPFFGMKPYEIIEYGNRKAAFIGVDTPETVTSTNPVNLKENGEIVVSFSADTPEQFYAAVQANINECRAAGADYVILLAHMGTEPPFEAYGSTALIANTEGVDVILDAHSHSFLCEDYITDRNGKKVLRSSTGTKLQSVGKLLISAQGNISTSLIVSYPDRDEEVQLFIDKIEAEYEAETAIPVGKTDYDLMISDAEGIRMVRSRETNMGDLIADSCREVLGAQIGWVNGGGIRDSIVKGDITMGDILKVSPFGTEMSLISAKGQHILDGLEMASMKTLNSYRNGNGGPSGESGSFAQVSGLKYTVDTSVPSSVVLDGQGAFVEVSGDRRVKDVYVENFDGTWEELDTDKYYSVAISKFISKEGGDGLNMFIEDEILLDGCDQDYNVFMRYITENLGGVIPEKYKSPQGRITVK